MEKRKSTGVITGRIKVVEVGLTEEEVFDAIKEALITKFSKFKVDISGKTKDIVFSCL